MRFPPSLIERLRSHFLISEVIGRRIAIKKHGREYQALCPFHNEKTPSFTINDEKSFYHCFGCGAHGDAIEFIRRYEKLSYPETIEKLAREAGIPLPRPDAEKSKKVEAEKTLGEVTEAACKWFERQLSLSIGAAARDYVERRGLKADTLRLFRIGYAPDERAALHQYLLKEGFPQALQAEAGLIIVPEHGGAYDRFRGRVIFPIRNPSGKVIAFGGRMIANTANKNLPKYLNSSETPLFKKGDVLFNLDLAKKPARETGMTVVMEGYMDVVSSYQSGIHYAMATLGTAVTPEHLRLLWQLTKEPVLCLDGDAAGSRAMLRAAETALPLLKPGFSLRFALLPKGEDPDTYVQKHGKPAFEALLSKAKRLYVTLWEQLLAEHKKLDLGRPETRAALQEKCRLLAGRIADGAVKKHYADYFNEQLWKELRLARRATATPRSAEVERMAAQDPAFLAADRLAERLLILSLKFPTLLHKDHRDEIIAELSIHDPRLTALRKAMLESLLVEDDFLAQVQAHYPELPDLLQAASLKLPYPDTLSAEDSLTLWNETHKAYTRAQLVMECKALEESLVHAIDDESAYRQKITRIEEIKKIQSHSFAPAEPDMA